MMSLLLIFLALVGHVLLGALAFNQLHSRMLLFRFGQWLTLTEMAFMALAPFPMAYWCLSAGAVLVGDSSWIGRLAWPAQWYGGLCVVAGAIGTPWWLWERWRAHHPVNIRSHRARLVDLERPTHHDAAETEDHHILTRLPGNQTLLLDVVERGLELERLTPALEGLSLVHLSDFHLSGRIAKGYFQEVVRLSNQLQPDLVAITGDVVDRDECLEWIPDLFGQLTSRAGAYFVLGNHDMRVDAARLRRSLVAAGLTDLGGRWVQREVRGQPVVLAGTEVPWGLPAPDLRDAPPRGDGTGPLRIALSHTPDQFHWAQANQFDLILAGHTHGGQIRLPLIGAIFSATRLGVRYACGTFHVPPTVMHVSRGVSAEVPLRMNCPPEMIKITLHAPGS